MKLGKTQVVVGNNGNEMSNKRAARGKLLFFYSKPIDFCRSRRSDRVRKFRRRLCTSSVQGKIGHFHVVVVQWRQSNVQKSAMHVQNCCFAN